MNTPEAQGVDFESLLSDAYTQMLASGELKLPEQGTFLGNVTHGIVGTEHQPATFKPAMGATAPAPAAQPTKATPAPAKVTSLADYNALPSGALYVHPKDGKTYRKK